LLALELAPLLQPGDRVLLEGPLGAGKTTLAKALLKALGVSQPPEGSPTFAIAHEYQSSRGDIIHIDFYRLKSEEEIDEAGIPSYFWERKGIVICEWLSSWPFFQEQVQKSGRIWKIQLSFGKNVHKRDLIIQFQNHLDFPF
jgi:tRNA threonylcarbamoyl adenosine modification protein YjeE